jgi:hypothetical protein
MVERTKTNPTATRPRVDHQVVGAASFSSPPRGGCVKLTKAPGPKVLGRARSPSFADFQPWPPNWRLSIEESAVCGPASGAGGRRPGARGGFEI